MKKIITILANILIVILSVFLLISCIGINNTPATKDKSVTKILALGDSIAGGVAGTYPEKERNNYSYLELVGQINEFSYKTWL